VSDDEKEKDFIERKGEERIRMKKEFYNDDPYSDKNEEFLNSQA
jgi:hypothetical protein